MLFYRLCLCLCRLTFIFHKDPIDDGIMIKPLRVVFSIPSQRFSIELNIFRRSADLIFGHIRLKNSSSQIITLPPLDCTVHNRHDQLNTSFAFLMTFFAQELELCAPEQREDSFFLPTSLNDGEMVVFLRLHCCLDSVSWLLH